MANAARTPTVKITNAFDVFAKGFKAMQLSKGAMFATLSKVVEDGTCMAAPCRLVVCKST
jgi:hypothetical protein